MAFAHTEYERTVVRTTEYIKREHAVDAAVDVYYNTPDIDLSCEKFEAAILKIPPSDVEPVRHGRWEKQSGLYSCSERGRTCPYDVQADVIEYWACNYCPNCGAKMDG